MNKELFDISTLQVTDTGWVKKYCLNRLAELKNTKSICRHLLVGGGIGGDIDWGIHRWDENTLIDFGVEKFDGYRFYVGEDEHGIDGKGDMQDFCSEEEIKQKLLEIVIWHLHVFPENKNDLMALKEEFQLNDWNKRGQSKIKRL